MKIQFQHIVLICVIAFILCHMLFISLRQYRSQDNAAVTQLKLQQLNTTLFALNRELQAIHSQQQLKMKSRNEQLRRTTAAKNPNRESEDFFKSPVAGSNVDLHDRKSSQNGFIDANNVKITKNEQIENRINAEVKAAKKPPKKILLFTMDSISSYEINSQQGGASGEIIIRKSLQEAFEHFGARVDICRSDSDFETKNGKDYDIIILDPWTWAGKGWVPKPNIRGLDDRMFVLDFFGSTSLRGPAAPKVPTERILTAFGSPWNPMLGYYIKAPPGAAGGLVGGPGVEPEAEPLVKVRQGVIWGKDIKHFDSKHDVLVAAADIVPLVSTATAQAFQHPQIAWRGHQTPEQWMQLLRSSKFLLGLGDPLLGPSAIDAIVNGCVFINPIYDEPVRDGAFASQHPYAQDKIGKPYVCSYRISNKDELRACVEYAVSVDLPPLVPEAFRWEAYLGRVQTIFHL